MGLRFWGVVLWSSGTIVLRSGLESRSRRTADTCRDHPPGGHFLPVPRLRSFRYSHPRRPRPGRSRPRCRKLDEFARQIIDKKLVPGLSIAIVHRDEVVFLNAFGVREAGKPEAVDVDTVFQLASVSKPLASTVFSALVSDRKVSDA
jgi:CubicO group peptidase (beta-lactamase class C family)